MSKCPKCGYNGAYIGLSLVSCPNDECQNYDPPKSKNSSNVRMARVLWCIGRTDGYSRWLPYEEAKKRVIEGNKKYGDNTHFLEEKE